MACQSLQDVAAEFRRLALSSTILAIVASRRPIRQPERPNQRVDAGPDGGVRDLQLALEFLGVAPGPKETLEKRQLLAAQSPEATDVEVAFDCCAATATLKPRYRKLA